MRAGDPWTLALHSAQLAEESAKKQSPLSSENETAAPCSAPHCKTSLVRACVLSMDGGSNFCLLVVKVEAGKIVWSEKGGRRLCTMWGACAGRASAKSDKTRQNKDFR